MLPQITIPDPPSTVSDPQTNAGHHGRGGEGPQPGAVPASALSAAEIAALVDASVDVVLVFDVDGRYLRVVQTGRRGLYRPVAGVLGRRLDEVLPPELAARALAAIGTALATGRAQSIEYTLEFDGATVWLAATVAPTAEGTVVWVARDVSAQRRAELALRESEQRHRRLLENLPVITYQVEAAASHAALYVSRGVASLGYTPEEWLAAPDTWVRCLHPDDRERVLAETRASLAGGVAGEYEYRLVAKDGTVRWYHDRGDFLRDGSGRPTVWQGIMLDVTERRRAQEALRASEEHFRAVFHQAAVGISILDADGRLVDANAAFEQFLGYGLDELRGRIAGEFSPPEDAAITRQPVRDLKAGRVESVSVEKRFVRRDGTVRWGVLTLSQIRAQDGRWGIVGLVQDITQRKQAEETTARLTAVLELTPDVVAISAPTGRLEYVNRAGRELLGLGDALPASGLTVADVQPELVQSGALAGAVRAALRAGQWRGEATLRRHDGRELPVEQILLAHRGPDGAPDYLSTVLRDITERKQVEVALRDLALVDELTGLYNRRGFMAMAEQEWRRARRGGWPVLACYADLDDFKAINDTYGHAEGDEALRAVAALLRGIFREADVLGRPGGDEFTVLVPHADPGTEAVVLRRVEERLAAHNAMSRRPYALSLSVGIARAEVGDEGSLADLIARADAALYERKRLKPTIART